MKRKNQLINYPNDYIIVPIHYRGSATFVNPNKSQGNIC